MNRIFCTFGGMARPAGTKNIKTPELMWEYFDQYRKETKQNPIQVQDFVGKDAIEVNRKKERCLTFEGFTNWLEDNGIITDVTDYFENKDKRYTDYIRVCSRIKRTIRQDQIEGGMVGIYNPSITQRLNSLAEQTEVKSKVITIQVENDEDE